jgi:hypothetical protein
MDEASVCAPKGGVSLGVAPGGNLNQKVFAQSQLLCEPIQCQAIVPVNCHGSAIHGFFSAAPSVGTSNQPLGLPFCDFQTPAVGESLAGYHLERMCRRNRSRRKKNPPQGGPKTQRPCAQHFWVIHLRHLRRDPGPRIEVRGDGKEKFSTSSAISAVNYYVSASRSA